MSRKYLVFAVLLMFACSKNPTAEKPSQYGTITGVVHDGSTWTGIAGVTIHTNPPTEVVTTEDAGSFEVKNVLSGVYRVYANKLGFDTVSVSISVQAGLKTTADFVLFADSLANKN